MDAKNSVDLDTDPCSIVGSRLLDAPRELVFSVWTDPKHLAQWWGPNGFTTTTHSFDFRPGGQWRFVMHGPDGRDYQNLVTFDEISRPERIVYRHGGTVDVEPVQFKTIAKLMYSVVSAAAVRPFSSPRRLLRSGVEISPFAATAAVMIFMSDIKLR